MFIIPWWWDVQKNWRERKGKGMKIQVQLLRVVVMENFIKLRERNKIGETIMETRS